jgi:FlaA1/EpsC-like NDP-sugar epimerase
LLPGIDGVLTSNAYVTEGSTEFVIDPIDLVIAVEGVIVLMVDHEKCAQI